VALITVGTLGLKLLPGLYTGEPLSWVDASFTITSAVCVTGLIVVDTATYFTVWGQAWILLFIQLGGLGIITFTTLLTLALGQRLSLRSESLSTGALDVAPHLDFRRLARDVVLFTVLIELAGAVALYAIWVPRLGWSGALWPALFHSISAFCNAGFSTYSDNLISFQDSPLTLLVIGGLIVSGGLGFLTLEELWLWRRQVRRQRAREVALGSPWRASLWRPGRRRRHWGGRISLHSRLVLATTGILIVGGWLLLMAMEWNSLLGELSPGMKAVNALFISITPRTAGFNNIDYGKADDSTNFLTMILMGIGGSPGSTAGGLKTTTIALIVLLAWSRFRGREITSLWGRSIPEETIQRAVGLTVTVAGLMLISVLMLTLTEQRDFRVAGGQEQFLAYAFECMSAFNTVGLSMGLTPYLSVAGKLLMIALMFMGRVGPATTAAALSLPAPTGEGEFRYAYEDVIVG
jgi:trk system potassium uptake protein TrkH